MEGVPTGTDYLLIYWLVNHDQLVILIPKSCSIVDTPPLGRIAVVNMDNIMCLQGFLNTELPLSGCNTSASLCSLQTRSYRNW
jgi:hypothetical protein